jgi:histidine triad (HIT) family protein
MPSTDCVFCRIVAGELPCTRVFEDTDLLAFMDIGPVVKGHTLVVPKRHCDPITCTPPDLLCKLIAAVQRVARAQMEGLGADGVNVAQANGKCAGQIVPHIHFHVIPRFAHDGHSFNWTPCQYDGADEMERYADPIRRALGKEDR